MEEDNLDLFKQSFKYYKSKSLIPTFEEVIDLQHYEIDKRVCRKFLGNNHTFNDNLIWGLQPVNNWCAFELINHPGLLVIRNPFTTQGQRYWMARCLRDYPKYPNEVNLNRTLFDENVLHDWWQALQQSDDKHEIRRLNISMRWATLGYHHNWDTKVYSENRRSEFPADLSNLCSTFANVLQFSFKAQAAIVNYYPIGTTLAGHTDHSEQNLSAPLFSFSFGQTAIFLIGGVTKDIKPSALYLRSGDVLVMSKESRTCYHAVPRVMNCGNEHWNELLTNKTEIDKLEGQRKRLRLEPIVEPNKWKMDTQLYQQIVDELHWAPFKQYLHGARININVRQVLQDDKVYLS